MADKVLSFTPTARGYMHASFTDSLGAECYIQESSNERDCFIWVGMLEGDAKVVAAMHLNQDQVRALIPALQFFADYGHLRMEIEEVNNDG